LRPYIWRKKQELSHDTRTACGLSSLSYKHTQLHLYPTPLRFEHLPMILAESMWMLHGLSLLLFSNARRKGKKYNKHISSLLALSISIFAPGSEDHHLPHQKMRVPQRYKSSPHVIHHLILAELSRRRRALPAVDIRLGLTGFQQTPCYPSSNESPEPSSRSEQTSLPIRLTRSNHLVARRYCIPRLPVYHQRIHLPDACLTRQRHNTLEQSRNSTCSA